MSVKTALVPVADGSEDIETVCIIDVLRRAEVAVTVACVMAGRLEIEAARGTRIVADINIEDCRHLQYDLIALPGGLAGAENLRDCATLIEMLNRQRDSGQWFAAICASPALVFAGHHLDEGVRTTAHPGFTQSLSAFQDATTVVDRHCITSQGPGTAIEFALTLVEALLGKAKREEVAKPMVLGHAAAAPT
ncbi:MAG: DJ-1 family glyoxalase III [Ketobacter sp.]